MKSDGKRLIVKEISRAKLNLALYVTGKRDDGYHDLCSLMSSIELCDDLEFDFQTSKVSVLCSHPDVPEDHTNLVCRAAVLFFDKFLGIDKKQALTRGVAIKIRKRIPVGAGLGGGSSNAATVLKVLNRWYENPFSNMQLMKMGLSIGADVPFFIHGCPAVAQGVGEKLKKCNPLLPYHVLLFFPGITASTADVYKNIEFPLTKYGKSNINNLLNICESGREVDVKDFLHNDLESAALRLYPDIGYVKKEMVRFLPEGVLMTGSGSSFFALFFDHGKAERAFRELSKKWEGNGKKIFLTCFATS